MKINQAVEEIERGNVGEERRFTIQANARAFQILSSNLYPDKIKAVIRELCCNALDSHVAAGKVDVPFDVHLPNNMEPYFSVTDYGLGLSHEQVMSIYTTYFLSTKTHTNELIGGLGLGSKSPFSYTNTFDVTAIHNGRSVSYAMFINEAGEPSAVPMGESLTDQPNGVCVRMPVKNTDFDLFREKAELVLKWFVHKPVVSGNSRFRMPEIRINADMQGKGWRLLHNDGGYGYRNQTAFALMGNVAYPLKASVLDSKYHTLLNWGLVIDFGIGELDVSASREDISYDEVTVDVIHKRLDQVLRELQAFVSAKFASAKTMWEARIIMAEINNNYEIRSILNALIKSGFVPEFQGKAIRDDSHSVNWHNLFVPTPRVQNNLGVWVDQPQLDPAPNVYNVSEWSKARGVASVAPSNKVTFILKDTSDAVARGKQAFYDKDSYNRSKIALVIEGAFGWDATKCKQVKKLLDYLGNPPTILASSLPKPPKKAMKFKGMVWTGKASSWRPRKSDNWSLETELTTNQGGYYCTLSGLEAIVGPAAGEDKNYNISTVINCAKSLGIINKDDKVWGINKTNSKLVKEETNWKNIYHHVRDKVVELIANTNIAAMVHALEQSNHISSIVLTQADHWFRLFGTMPNAMGEFARAWHTASTANSKINLRDLRQLAHVFGISLDDKVTHQGVDLIKLYHDAVKTYPLMVKFVRDSSGDQHWNLLKDYVKLVDTVGN